MMTSSNGNIIRVTGPLCGEFTGHRWSALNKRLIIQSWGWWFESPSRSLWRHFNDKLKYVRLWNNKNVPCLAPQDEQRGINYNYLKENNRRLIKPKEQLVVTWQLLRGTVYKRTLCNIVPALHICINPLWRTDSIWRYRNGSALVQVMACCLGAPIH